MTRSLSTQQQAVVDFVRNGRGSAFVEAVAGAGKTTTAMFAVAEAKGSIAVMAYNKAAALEFTAKAKELGLNFDNRVRFGTCHSFGFGGWRYAYPKVKSGPDAAREKTDMMVKEFDIPRSLQGFVPKLISLAKQNAIGLNGAIDDVSLYYDIISHHDLDYEIENLEHVAVGVELARKGMHWHREMGDRIIDFDDMIWLPVISGIRLWQNDFLVGDEWQDANPARRALARKMLKRDGRGLFIGDRHQAIYGFTGADADSIDNTISDFNCAELPMTVTFRCPKAVVAKAQEVVGHIQAHENAPEGSVREMELEEFLKIGTEVKGIDPPFGLFDPVHDAILCRNMRPLVMTAYQLIKRGIACHVEGRDIGMGLIKLVNRFEGRTLLDLRDKMKAYAEVETEKLKAKGRETAAEALQDRIDTILVIMGDVAVTSVDVLRQKIMDLFVDSNNERKPTLTLSTVHRSKGREWRRVFVYGANVYMPSKYARQAWQMEQEANLEYVAYTRAKSELILVNAVEG